MMETHYEEDNCRRNGSRSDGGITGTLWLRRTAGIKLCGFHELLVIHQLLVLSAKHFPVASSRGNDGGFDLQYHKLYHELYHDPSQISAENAKQIALADAGLTESDVTELKAELDTDDAVAHYDVDFKAKGMEHDYDIDANTGAILSHNTEVDD